MTASVEKDLEMQEKTLKADADMNSTYPKVDTMYVCMYVCMYMCVCRI
jgi:hypothetical protein